MFHRWLLKGIGIVCLCLFLLPVHAEEQVKSSADYKGALCLIKADDKLVLVNEIITKSLSLPGGTIRADESPQVTAQRETWEETGIAVTVGDVLGYTEDATVFDCVSSSEILAYQYQNSLRGYELPVWFAPSYGIEIASATLVNPHLVDEQSYRFPQDWNVTLEMFEKGTNQQVKVVSDLMHKAPAFHQNELRWVQQFQSWVNSLPNFLSQFIHNTLLIGNLLASPICGIILLPVLYWRCGKSVCYKVGFAISITSLLCLFAQQGFSLPRPHVYFPSIKLISSYGNGFPSLPITVWSSIGILLMTEREKLGDGWFVAGYLLSAIWLILSKFYLGTAFIIDMIIGGFLGLLITWNIVRFDVKKTEKARTIMGSKRVWWGITVVATVFTYYWQLPVFAAWLVVLIVMTPMIAMLQNQREYLSSPHAAVFTLILAVVYMLMSYVSELPTMSGMWSLSVELARYPMMILVFVLLIRRTKPQHTN